MALRGLLTLTFAILLLDGCGGGGTPLYSIGGTVGGLVGSRLALQNNGSITTIEPAANGYNPSLFTALPSGASYEVTVVTQPTTPSQTCVVTNGKGTIASADVTDITVSCTTTPAHFLLGEGETGGVPCIKTSVIDSTSGALSPTSGSPICGGVYDNQGNFLGSLPGRPMVVDPQGRFLYMALGVGQIGLIPMFAIDRGSGALTFVNSTSVGRLNLIALDPSGRFLFATSYDGYVTTFTVESGSGALTESGSLDLPTPSGGTCACQAGPTAVSVDPLDRFVYVVYGDMVIALSLDSESGALSQIAPPAAIGGTNDTTVWFAPHPSGNSLYVGNFASNNIAAFSVDPTSGTLSPVVGSPFAAGNSPSSGAIDPYGKYLYVTNSASNDITAYAIDSGSGILTPINGSPFPTGNAPSAVAVEPLGHFIYVANALGVSAYEIDSSTGALTQISGSPFPFAYGAVISY